MADRLIDPHELGGELEGPVNIRPKRLEEYIGQSKVKDSLKIAIEAAKMRGEPLDHLLFYGPPGLGKTTLSRIIANEMEAEIQLTSGPALERAGDLATILTNLEKHDILFIDEIHRMNRMVEETIYPAMEDFKIDMVTGKGPSARTFRLDLNHFTLIGATTRAGLLTNPLRERFGILHSMNFYEVEELEQIITRSARILEVPIKKDAALEIARRSRGTPRIANRLLKRVRDYAEVKGTGEIVLDISMHALDSLGVDPLGLDDLDRRFLMVIIENYSGGPVGVEAIAATLPEEVDTITEVIEPFLLKAGLVNRTPRGRTATVKAYEHLGLKPPLSDPNSLF